MHTLIQPIRLARPALAAAATAQDATAARRFAVPHCDIVEKPDRWMATLYLPGTVARGIELFVSGRRIAVTARRDRPVRVNWWALGLERCLKDYRLELYLGRRFDPTSLRAEFTNGVLTLSADRARAATVPSPTQATVHVA